jgi:hypothetical protein
MNKEGREVENRVGIETRILRIFSYINRTNERFDIILNAY